jgi:hypothetical protein
MTPDLRGQGAPHSQVTCCYRAPSTGDGGAICAKSGGSDLTMFSVVFRKLRDRFLSVKKILDALLQ